MKDFPEPDRRACRSSLPVMARSFVLATLMLTGVQTAAALADTPAEPGRPAKESVPAAGMGDVNVYPTRIVISGNRTIGAIGLLNRSSSAGEYDIELTEMVMMPDGSVKGAADVSDPALLAGLKPASPYLRWSPHHVVLKGGEAQAVRAMIHLPGDLPAGEYRSHFLITSNPPMQSGEQASEDPPKNGIGTRITARFGVSLPVIVRVGETTLTVGMTDLALTTVEGARFLTLTLTRAGTRSAYGNLSVYASGRKAPIAMALGLGIYPEIDHRVIRLGIDPSVPANLLKSGTRLTAVFVDDDMNPGKELARQEVVVP